MLLLKLAIKVEFQ